MPKPIRSMKTVRNMTRTDGPFFMIETRQKRGPDVRTQQLTCSEFMGVQARVKRPGRSPRLAKRRILFVPLRDHEGIRAGARAQLRREIVRGGFEQVVL